MKKTIAVVVICLAATGCSSDKKASSDSAEHKVDVSISPQGCRPDPLQLKAGTTSFTVTNNGADTSNEFEILKGEKVLGEVEGVAPGLTRTFSLTLAEGEYISYCPGTTDEKGVVTVTSATSSTS